MKSCLHPFDAIAADPCPYRQQPTGQGRLWLISILALYPLLTAFSEEHAPAQPTTTQNESEAGAPVATPAGHSRYWQRITSYEPTYFLLEAAPPASRKMNAKLQMSFAFQIIGDPQMTIAPGDERATGFYGAFSQTSFWDLGSDSKPFFDSSYRPELFWHQGFKPGLFGSGGLAGAVGLSHESNGRAGDDSRSYNTAFIRPVVRWDLNDDWWFRVSPRVFTYVGTLDENPEIKRYRGYGYLDLALGLRDGVLLTLRSRIGDQADRGSVQADLSYPTDRITGGWTHGFVYAQYFWGWSENLLAYDQRVEDPRLLIGFAITR